MNDLGVEYYEAKGEAAFYGPKLDVQVRSAMGHDITLSTIQLDYQLPERFKLEYVNDKEEKERPVVIHRAILGSLDRFMAFLLEEYKGAFPTWLAPVQVKLLPIADRHIEYANKVRETLTKANIRAEVDDRREKTGYKIREAQLQKIPYMIVIGDKEVEANTVGVRSRKDGDLGQIPTQDFVDKILEEVENYK